MNYRNVKISKMLKVLESYKMMVDVYRRKVFALIKLKDQTIKMCNSEYNTKAKQIQRNLCVISMLELELDKFHYVLMQKKDRFISFLENLEEPVSTILKFKYIGTVNLDKLTMLFKMGKFRIHEMMGKGIKILAEMLPKDVKSILCYT